MSGTARGTIYQSGWRKRYDESARFPSLLFHSFSLVYLFCLLVHERYSVVFLLGFIWKSDGPFSLFPGLSRDSRRVVFIPVYSVYIRLGLYTLGIFSFRPSILN